MKSPLTPQAVRPYRRWLLAGLATLTLVLVPTACGSGSGSGTKSTTTTTAPGY